MTHLDRLERIEQQTKRAMTRDGTTEMQFGLVLVIFGILFYLQTPLAALGALFPIALAPLTRWLRRRLVHPRIGYAAVSKQKAPFRGIFWTAIGAIVVLLAAFGIFAAIAGIDRGRDLWLGYFVPVFGGCLLAIGPWVIARTYSLARWYVAALLFPLGGVVLPIAGIAYGYRALSLELGVVGGLALLYGLALFTTFLRRYPVIEIHTEESHGAER